MHLANILVRGRRKQRLFRKPTCGLPGILNQEFKETSFPMKTSRQQLPFIESARDKINERVKTLKDGKHMSRI